MIAAALPPMPGASSATSAGPAETAPPHEAGTRDGAAAGSGAPKPQRAHRGGTADAVARRDEPGADARDGEAGRDFAELLQAGTAGDGAAAAPADAVAGPASAEPAAGNLPDRLLALLAGALAVPATPASQAAAALAPAAPASSSARPAPSPPAALAGALPATAAAAGAALAASPAGAGAANAVADGDAFAALAKLAVDATTDDGAVAAPGDATQAPLASATLAPTAPGPRPLVAPGAPLALPADPDAGFDDGFGARIAWMAEQRLGHAEIRLNPEHLGPIDVRVQLDGTRVAAEFHSAHAEVRQAIEASVPRLREMLGQHGLQLGHADVGQRHAQGQAPRRDDARGDGSDADAGAARPPANAPRLRSRGLLDEYA